jgi:hypothetical protein
MVKGLGEYSEEAIAIRLDAVISLLYMLVEKLEGKEYSIREKVKHLTDVGLDNQSVAKILKISEKHVSKEKSLMKEKNG